MAGMTPEGFVPETFESLRLQIYERVRAELGPVPLDESTIEGLTLDIIIEAMIKLWEIAEVCYSAIDIDKATGAALDALCILTGTFRRPATFSIGESVILTGVPATLVPSGSEASSGPTGTTVRTIGDATIVASLAIAPLTAYVLGTIRTNAGNVYYAHDDVPNTIAAPTHTNRPTGFSFGPLDPQTYWTWVGEGTGHIAGVKARATLTGPRAVPTFALTDRETNIVGWDGVGNSADFTLGRNQETDEELRVSREAQIQAPGTSTKKAIRSALLAADPVNIVQVTVFMNNTDGTVDGMPPHSVEALVRGGEDQLIFDTLLENVAAGIATHGNTDGFAVDEEGTSESMSFSRPVEKPIYVVVQLTKEADVYPDDGDAQVKAAIVAYGQAQNTGRDVVSSALIGAVFKAVPGIIDITAMFIGLAPAPGTAVTIPIALRELAVHDTARITVTSINGVP